MNKKSIIVLPVAVFVLAACGNTSSASGSSVAPASSETSLPEVSSSDDSSSFAESSSSFSSSEQTVYKNVSFMPSDAPGKENNTYPVGATATIEDIVFGMSDIMAGNQNPYDANGKAIGDLKLDVIQGRKATGAIYNSTAFPVKTVKLTYLDQTSEYNVAAPIESVYGGEESHPMTAKASGGAQTKGFVAASTDYKVFTQTFTFEEAVNYLTIANDGDTDGGDGSRAVYFTSIEFNPVE
jgi:predicted small secreted protein